MATSTDITSARFRHGDGLPFAVINVEPVPSLASRQASYCLANAAEQARAMNAVLAQLTAILAEGGQHA